MDQKDKTPQQGNPGQQNPGQQNPGNRDTDRDVTNREEDLQREGNLGNERNRNQPDTERRPGGNRENMNR
jgi:hypothetical protein